MINHSAPALTGLPFEKYQAEFSALFLEDRKILKIQDLFRRTFFGFELTLIKQDHSSNTVTHIRWMMLLLKTKETPELQ
jgi:hypothetical protein